MSMLRITMVVVSVIVAGCGGQLQSPLDRMKSELSSLPGLVHGNRPPSKAFYAALQGLISELPEEEQLKAFHFFEEILEEPCLADTTLSERQQSLDVYLGIIKSVVEILVKELENPEPAWEFLLFAMDIFDCERETVSASTYNPHVPSSGLCMDKGQYLSELETNKSRTIEECFMHGAFRRYFSGLSIDGQRRWLSWLDFMAGRKVSIENPMNPDEKMALGFFRLPPSMRRRVAEKRNRKSPRNATQTKPTVYSNDDL